VLKRFRLVRVAAVVRDRFAALGVNSRSIRSVGLRQQPSDAALELSLTERTADRCSGRVLLGDFVWLFPNFMYQQEGRIFLPMSDLTQGLPLRLGGRTQRTLEEQIRSGLRIDGFSFRMLSKVDLQKLVECAHQYANRGFLEQVANSAKAPTPKLIRTRTAKDRESPTFRVSIQEQRRIAAAQAIKTKHFEIPKWAEILPKAKNGNDGQPKRTGVPVITRRSPSPKGQRNVRESRQEVPASRPTGVSSRAPSSTLAQKKPFRYTMGPQSAQNDKSAEFSREEWIPKKRRRS